MQNAGQIGPGAATAHQPQQFVPSEPSPTGGSITSSLRQFRKKDVEKSQSDQPLKQVSESHVARVAPHNHYPPVVNEYRYQYTDYSHQIKYSDIPETSQPNPISTSVIQKPKPKEYMEMCNVQQPHMKPTYPDHLNNHQQYSPENAQYMHKEPSQGIPSGYKPESHYYSKEQHQYQQLPHHTVQQKYPNMMAPNVRKYHSPAPTENNFLNKLRQMHPSMARSIISDHHLQDMQSSYPTMDQRTMYAQQNHRYYPGTIHQASPYATNTNYPVNPPHHYPNYPTTSCNYPRPAQMGPVAPRYPHLERSISPARRGYHENMHLSHMNYTSYPQKMPTAHNFAPQYTGPEYAQHYQHRRMTQDYFSQAGRPPAQYMPNHHEMSLPAQEMSEITESRVSPSDSIKKFIENWADEEPASDINPLDANLNMQENVKLREETSSGTVYIATYLENNGIPLVASENGGIQLTPENYQYLLKNGLIDNNGMVRIIEANKDVTIDPNGNHERVVNLQIMETTKSDCMMTNKNVRVVDGSITSINNLASEEQNKRVVIHQNTLLTPSLPVTNKESGSEKSPFPLPNTDLVATHQNQSVTKELVDKNCSPINLDLLQDNLDFSDLSQSKSENLTDPVISSNNSQLTKDDNHENNLSNSEKVGNDLFGDLNDNSEDSQNKSPSRSMPIIDLFSEAHCDEGQSDTKTKDEYNQSKLDSSGTESSDSVEKSTNEDLSSNITINNEYNLILNNHDPENINQSNVIRESKFDSKELMEAEDGVKQCTAYLDNSLNSSIKNAGSKVIPRGVIVSVDSVKQEEIILESNKKAKEVMPDINTSSSDNKVLEFRNESLSGLLKSNSENKSSNFHENYEPKSLKELAKTASNKVPGNKLTSYNSQTTSPEKEQGSLELKYPEKNYEDISSTSTSNSIINENVKTFETKETQEQTNMENISNNVLQNNQDIKKTLETKSNINKSETCNYNSEINAAVKQENSVENPEIKAFKESESLPAPVLAIPKRKRFFSVEDIINHIGNNKKRDSVEIEPFTNLEKVKEFIEKESEFSSLQQMTKNNYAHTDKVKSQENYKQDHNNADNLAKDATPGNNFVDIHNEDISSAENNLESNTFKSDQNVLILNPIKNTKYNTSTKSFLDPVNEIKDDTLNDKIVQPLNLQKDRNALETASKDNILPMETAILGNICEINIKQENQKYSENIIKNGDTSNILADNSSEALTSKDNEYLIELNSPIKNHAEKNLEEFNVPKELPLDVNTTNLTIQNQVNNSEGSIANIPKNEAEHDQIKLQKENQEQKLLHCDVVISGINENMTILNKNTEVGQVIVDSIKDSKENEEGKQQSLCCNDNSDENTHKDIQCDSACDKQTFVATRDEINDTKKEKEELLSSRETPYVKENSAMEYETIKQEQSVINFSKQDNDVEESMSKENKLTIPTCNILKKEVDRPSSATSTSSRTTDMETRASTPNSIQYRSAIRVEESSILLQIGGELLEISVNVVDGKKVVTVVPLADTTVVDYNDNYEITTNIEYNSNITTNVMVVDSKDMNIIENKETETDVSLFSSESSILSKEEQESKTSEEICMKDTELVEIKVEVPEAIQEEHVISLEKNKPEILLKESDISLAYEPETELDHIAENVVICSEDDTTSSKLLKEINEISETNKEINKNVTILLNNVKEDTNELASNNTCDKKLSETPNTLNQQGDLILPEFNKSDSNKKINSSPLHNKELELNASAKHKDDDIPKKNKTEEVLKNLPNNSVLNSGKIESLYKEKNNDEIEAFETLVEDDDVFLPSESNKEDLKDSKDLDGEENKKSLSHPILEPQITDVKLKTDEPLNREIKNIDIKSKFRSHSEEFLLNEDSYISENFAVKLNSNVKDNKSIYTESDANVKEVEAVTEEPKREYIRKEEKVFKPELIILSPTSTNIEDHLGASKENVYLAPKQKFTLEQDDTEISSGLTTKAAKKSYDNALQIPAVTTTDDVKTKANKRSVKYCFDRVSSSKREKATKEERIRNSPKRSKRINDLTRARNEQKELLRQLVESRKLKKAKQEKHSNIKNNESQVIDRNNPSTSDDHKDLSTELDGDDEYVDFKELLKARKLKKLKKMQEIQRNNKHIKGNLVPVEQNQNIKFVQDSTKDEKSNEVSSSLTREKKIGKAGGCCIGCNSTYSKVKANKESQPKPKKMKRSLELDTEFEKEENAHSLNDMEHKIVEKVKPIQDIPKAHEQNSTNINLQPKTTTNDNTKTFEGVKVQRRVTFSDEMPSSTSSSVTSTPTMETSKPLHIKRQTSLQHIPNSKDPRKKSIGSSSQVIVPCVAELMEENSKIAPKRKISLADYVSRKRKLSSDDVKKSNTDSREPKEKKICKAERKEREEQIKSEVVDSEDSNTYSLNIEAKKSNRTVRTSFVIHSSDWEDSESPKAFKNTSKEDCLIQDFSGLLNNNSGSKKPVIDINELTPIENPQDVKLQEYKEKVDMQLSSLNIQIPKYKPLNIDSKSSKLNLGSYGSPEANSLMLRFLKNEKITMSEMDKIRQIISYKKYIENQKNAQSPSKSPGCSSLTVSRSPAKLTYINSSLTSPVSCSSTCSKSSMYEIKSSLKTESNPKEMKLHLKKVNSKHKLSLDFKNEDTGSVVSDQSDYRAKKVPDYQVYNRLGENGIPKMIFKRNRQSVSDESDLNPIVMLERIDIRDAELFKEKYNVTLSNIN